MNSTDESKSIARQLLLDEATFRFDGMADTLTDGPVVALPSPDTWEFSFQFQSRHSGYGDRVGKMLLQVITPHSVKIVVEKGKVVSATMDGRWDMIEQKMLTK